MLKSKNKQIRNRTKEKKVDYRRTSSGDQKFIPTVN